MRRFRGLCAIALVLAAAAACGGEAEPAGREEPAGVDTGDTAAAVRVYAVDRYEGVRRLDPGTLAVIDSIDTGPRPHGIVATSDGRTLYITLEVDNEVLEVDVATHGILRRASVGDVPNEPTLSADDRYLFVPLRAGGGTDVVDTETMTVVRHLATGAAGHNAYTSADGSRVYSTSMGEDQIAVIDPVSLEIDHILSLSGQPRPVALTSDGTLAHVALSGLTGFITVDLATRREIARVSVPIPEGTPVPPLETYTHGLALTPDDRELWVAAYGTDRLYGYLMPEGRQIADIPVARGPHWLSLHPDGEPLYVTLEISGQVAAVHRGLREVIRVADVGRAPTRILAFRTPVP